MKKKAEKKPESDVKIIATNRKARRDYEILQTVEAGLSLLGSEVKSLRAGKANLKDAYAIPKGNEIFLFNMHISPYDKTGYSGHEPERQRKLLLHAREINKLIGMVDEKGMTLIPLRLYFRGKYAKVELGVCRGKRAHDKRATIIERETKRDMEREMKRRQ
ncbi:MAG: SsrA-binding protein SmpB [Candidatus Zixiibacteriota bacterium]|nr:MAG: SsrA-binding protein SmpB [candidate division Zixibacteria bacterium]